MREKKKNRIWKRGGKKYGKEKEEKSTAGKKARCMEVGGLPLLDPEITRKIMGNLREQSGKRGIEKIVEFLMQ